MKTFKLLVQYDGTGFHGWQWQDGVRTVQGVLAEGLRRLSGQTVTLHASSRTDAGVHAEALPVSFRMDTDLPPRAFVLGLNHYLPPDLQVLQCRVVREEFHARFSARGKTYRYRVQTGPAALPLWRHQAWHVPLPLDGPAMREAAGMLVGVHDFSAFRSAHCDAKSPVRDLRRLEVLHPEPNHWCFEAEAGGFLRNMVRVLAGTLVEVGLGRHPPEWVEALLRDGDRTRGGITAPAHGLTLLRVAYPPGLDDPLEQWPPTGEASDPVLGVG